MKDCHSQAELDVKYEIGSQKVGVYRYIPRVPSDVIVREETEFTR
jgi:hypothetical protein